MEADKFLRMCEICQLTPIQAWVVLLVDEACESDTATAALMIELMNKNSVEAQTRGSDG